MSAVPVRTSVEPLFAANHALWVRVWAATQGAALAVACYVLVDAAGGARQFAASRGAARTGAVVALLVAYHAVGVSSRAWILQRRWAVCLFVPLGWSIVVAAISTSATFSLLLLGAVLEGFVFLPFSWAIAALALILLASVSTLTVNGAKQDWGASLTLARIVGLLATGSTVATVMLYIHRANREAAVRSRLLRRLDDAQRDLAERSRESGVQDERQRLARDIHDTLAQGFTSVIKHLEAVELSLDPPRSTILHRDDDVLARLRPHLASAQTVSRASLAEIRRLVWALRPPQLVEATLGAALERIVAQWSEANGIPATCTISSIPPLQPEIDVIFLRATQESLSNVARHARASRVGVAMHCVDELVLLSVEDDGSGFDSAAEPCLEHMGLAGMRERVRPFGGRVLIESEIGTGTSITVALPLGAIS